MRNSPSQLFAPTKQNLITILLFLTGIIIVSCVQQPFQAIRFDSQFLVITPQIPEDYNIVISQNIGTKQLSVSPKPLQTKNLSQKFVAYKTSNYFIQKLTDNQYQKQRLSYLKGIKDFSSQYIQNNLPQNKQPMILQSKYYKEHTLPSTPLQIVNKPATQKQTQISPNSVNLYNQFKNFQNIKNKNQKDVLTEDDIQKQMFQNILKLGSYILIGLVLSFVIIKKATKSQPKLPRFNQQRKQLRLRDTMQEDDDASSSESDD